MKDYPLYEEFQQRKLPRDAGEWPASAIRIFRGLNKSGGDEEYKLSNRAMKTKVCSVTTSVSNREVAEELASKTSYTLENLKTLWHLSQCPLQHDFGVEYTEKDISAEPQ